MRAARAARADVPEHRRARFVQSLRRRLLRRGLPRFEMTVIVVATGLAGFGVSAGLLGLGVASMPVRYVVATLAAYVVFLLLVRLWAEWQRGRLEGPELDLLPDGDGGIGPEREWSGGDGRFGGGGAGRSWDPDAGVADVPCGAVRAGDAAGSWLDVDPDDAWVIVVPIVLLVAGIAAALAVVAAAPALLAEVLLDVLIVSGLYHRLRKLEPRSWLTTAVRRTWIPVVVVAALLAAGGFVVQRAVPQADSIGDVLPR